MQVPRFFQAGIDHDNRHHTELARGMMREIQFIGNNACVSDGHFEAVEHEVVRNYISFLELFLAEWRAQNAAPPKEAVEGWAVFRATPTSPLRQQGGGAVMATQSRCSA